MGSPVSTSSISGLSSTLSLESSSGSNTQTIKMMFLATTFVVLLAGVSCQDTNGTAPAGNMTDPVDVITFPPTLPPRVDLNLTDSDPVTNATEAPTTTMAPTTTPEPTTTTPEPTTTTTAAPTTTPEPCDYMKNPFYAKVKGFSDTNDDFKDLSENEMIFIYEMLAAAEGCNMMEFIKADTAERMFRLLLDLPLRHVTTFVAFASTALTNEGVIVPL